MPQPPPKRIQLTESGPETVDDLTLPDVPSIGGAPDPVALGFGPNPKLGDLIKPIPLNLNAPGMGPPINWPGGVNPLAPVPVAPLPGQPAPLKMPPGVPPNFIPGEEPGVWNAPGFGPPPAGRPLGPPNPWIPNPQANLMGVPTGGPSNLGNLSRLSGMA